MLDVLLFRMVGEERLDTSRRPDRIVLAGQQDHAVAVGGAPDDRADPLQRRGDMAEPAPLAHVTREKDDRDVDEPRTYRLIRPLVGLAIDVDEERSARSFQPANQPDELLGMLVRRNDVAEIHQTAGAAVGFTARTVMRSW